MNGRYLDEVDDLTRQYLISLRFDVRRDPGRIRVGKAAFLEQSRRLAIRPVSKRLVDRLNEWIGLIANPIQRKEPSRMFTTISTLLVALALLFGGAGATAYAAQGSLPDDFLYPVKTASEQAQWAFTRSAQSRLELQLHLSDRRVDEILALASQNSAVPLELATRLQEHFNLALQAAAALDEPARTQARQQITLRLEQHQQRLQSLPETPILLRMREMLRLQLQLAGGGQGDPEMLQLRHAPGGSSGEAPPGGDNAPGGYGPDEGPQFSGGADEAGTGYGPGPLGTQECDDCTPALDGTGPGPGPQNQGGAYQSGGGNGSGDAPPSQGDASPQEAGGTSSPGGSGGGSGDTQGGSGGGGGSNQP